MKLLEIFLLYILIFINVCIYFFIFHKLNVFIYDACILYCNEKVDPLLQINEQTFPYLVHVVKLSFLFHEQVGYLLPSLRLKCWMCKTYSLKWHVI